jgi:hypothetical protein
LELINRRRHSTGALFVISNKKTFVLITIETTHDPYWRRIISLLASWREVASGYVILCKWLVSGDIKGHLLSPKKFVMGSKGNFESTLFGFVGIHQGGKNDAEEN